MTGYGRAVRKCRGYSISIELRSINSKFFEISTRLPLMLNEKENELKEIIGSYVTRGKVSVSVSVERNSGKGTKLKVDKSFIKDYYNLLSQIKKEIKSDEKIQIQHLLQFTEIMKPENDEKISGYWNEIEKTLHIALKDLLKMKQAEGKYLEKDILKRLNNINSKLNLVREISKKNIEGVKDKFKKRISELIKDQNIIDKDRLEYEIILLSDKMDITEEIVRALSHVNYFYKNVKDRNELSGRRLNFLVQEINREINTIASKSLNSEISQNVVEMKEELERIKEQLQNVE